MPEGDTIHRTAHTLRRTIGGRTLLSVDWGDRPGLPSDGDLAGRRVAGVEARGKNLLVWLSDGRCIHTHLRMTGSWHVYRPGERWRKPVRRSVVALHTDEWVAVCFSAPVVRLLTEGRVERDDDLRHLGPDLARTDVDLAEARDRLRSAGRLQIGVALMRQRLVAGVGNVYKSEILFLEGLDPFRRVAEHDDAELDRLLRRANQLLLANLGGGPRVTRLDRRGERLWVYGRSGRPCRRCETQLAMRRQGREGRSTYFCPACQQVGRTATEGATQAGE